ncbi:laminin G [Azospirillum sp. B510]|uniref:LamG-like jellyroll fold domain-containing protein n=1 Tax=Azospirillum sp. (strain B510) TaxID=137722 RepID=UPI0001C4C2F0|nr:LamG-like jellyroll fold domain-containing protein [Azospirillum sp. B510]BAI71466.1 hypothetical protein AZL_008280 [Azospirillum sp. B510]BAI72685.1 laminin G [Azospirillum sp. B510]
MNLPQAFWDAIDRLKQYNLGVYNSVSNKFGLSGVGGMAANWRRHSSDLATASETVAGIADTVVSSQAAAAAAATAAAGSATAANASKTAAATSEGNAAAAAVAAAADRQAVATDKTAVHTDRLAADAAATATAADRQAVATDKAATHTDRLAADADAQATAADRIAVAADRSAVETDKDAAHADRLAADASAVAAAAAAAGVNLPAISSSDAGKALIVNPAGTGYQVGSAAATVSQSPVVYMSSGGTTTLTGKSVLAAYEQIAGQTFGVPYTNATDYVRDPSNSTTITSGVVSMTNTAGAVIDSATKLLIHGDGVNGSTEILDERGVTLFGTHCGWFDGASYWRVPASYKIAFGSTQNITYETFVRFSSISSQAYHVLLDGNTGGSAGIQIGVNGTSKQFYYYDGATRTHATVAQPDVSYHVAWVRYNGVSKLYINGVGSAGVGDAISYAAMPLGIGAMNNGNNPISGWQDQVRISKVARYTSDFTPPAAAFVPDADTVHLFTFDDGHGGQVLKDRANSGRPILLGGTGATISNEQAKFGTTSFKLGAGGSCVIGWASTPHADLALGDNNFTTDLWFYKTNTADGCLWCAGNNAYGMQIRTNGAGGAITAYISTDNSSWNVANGVGTGVVPAVNSWNHLAVVRNGGTLYIFLNGTQIGSHTVGTGSITMGGPYHYFGGVGDNSSIMAGYIDEVRIKRGEAVWISNFTPPTAPYTADDRTVVLLHFEGANGDVVTLDSSGSSYGTSAFSTTTTTLAFTNAAALSSAQARGGHSTSLYTGGSQFAQWLLPDNPAAGHPLYFGNYTKWCVEAWAYIPAGGSLAIFQIGQNPDSGSMRGGAGPSGTTFYVNGSAIATGPAPATGWNHFAFVREGRGWCVYVNGIAGAIAAPSTQFTTPGSVGNLWVGAWNNPPAIGDGYFDAIRITNGNPRYIANFTPGNLTNDDMTTLLWVFDGSVGQKWVKELSQNTAMVAANGNARTVKDGRWIAPTTAKINASTYQFGGGALQFFGQASDVLSLDAKIVAFGTGDFCIDLQLYVDGAPYTQQGLVCAGEYLVANQDFLFYREGAALRVSSSAGVVMEVSWSPSIGWHHLLANRISGTTRIFADGVLLGSVSDTSNYVASGNYQTWIGGFKPTSANGAKALTGLIDELRISIGNGRGYTANFTPPTIAYGQQYVTTPGWIATRPGVTSLDLSAFSSIDTVTPTYSTPPNTSLTFLISTDGYATPLRRWTGSAWVATAYSMAWNAGAGTLTTSATPAQLQAVGNTMAELQAGLLAMDVGAVNSLNVVAILSTTNPQFTPTLDALNIGMDEYTMVRPVTDYTVQKKKASGDQALKITRVAAGNANMVFDYIPVA